jgi:glucan phosphorylase
MDAGNHSHSPPAVTNYPGPSNQISAAGTFGGRPVGQKLIREVFAAGSGLEGSVPVIYLENYDVELARLMCAGVDVWLNTSLPPMEASGTSGMKAAVSGVPSLSVLDGWWIEGHVEDVTGWAIGDGTESVDRSSADADSLYRKPREQGHPTVLSRYHRLRARDADGDCHKRLVLQYRADGRSVRHKCVFAAHRSLGLIARLAMAS